MLTNGKNNVPFGPAFLLSVGLGQRAIEVEPEQSFFTQGDPADSVFCLKDGRAKATVVSASGKQATIGLLLPGDFFGEEALAAEPGLRTAAVTAVNTCIALKIGRDEMTRVMHREPALADQFLSFLLARNLRTQADLVDQILNNSEKRLARTLLMMAESETQDEPRTFLPPITQETLAEMVGTTRSRVSFFMNRFRNLGLIDYKDRIRVHRPRLKAALVGQLAEV
jgi:CRP-like cAMP-binding protein